MIEEKVGVGRMENGMAAAASGNGKVRVPEAKTLKNRTRKFSTEPLKVLLGSKPNVRNQSSQIQEPSETEPKEGAASYRRCF